MKYCVENDLSFFEFHDSEFSFVSFDGKDLVVSARLLNIRKNAAQNPFGHDMEIECTRISFKGFHAPAYEPGRTWRTGQNMANGPGRRITPGRPPDRFFRAGSPGEDPGGIAE